jgi:hypothetical protein
VAARSTAITRPVVIRRRTRSTTASSPGPPDAGKSRTEEGEDLTLAHGEVDVLDGGHGAVALGRSVNGDGRQARDPVGPMVPWVTVESRKRTLETIRGGNVRETARSTSWSDWALWPCLELLKAEKLGDTNTKSGSRTASVAPGAGARAGCEAR